MIEWINCLTGIRGNISLFPAEMLSEDESPGISFRLTENRVIKVCPDFRAKEIYIDGKLIAEPKPLELGVPAILRMGSRLLALCAVDETGWAENYCFPLWTLFETETFEVISTVRTSVEIPAVLKREGLFETDCLVAPYGLPVTIPLNHISDLLLGRSPS